MQAAPRITQVNASGNAFSEEFDPVREAWETSYTSGRRWSVRAYLRGLPPVTRAILIANIIVFAAQIVLHLALSAERSEFLTGLFALTPKQALGSTLRLWQLATYMFLHSITNPLHIVFNMFVLCVFGPEVERAMGVKRYSLLYFICGLVAALFSSLIWWSQTIIGASGAVLGLLAAYGSIFPNRVLNVFMMFPMKAKHLVLVVAALEILATIAGNPESRVASFAHIGGFLAGFLFMRYEWTVRSMLLKSIERHYDRELETDRQVRERVDRLLEKVSHEGIAGLTWRERTFLKRASRRFKKQNQ